MHRWAIAGLAAALVGLCGCGSSFDCTSSGPCSKVPPPTSDQISECQALSSDVCGDHFKDYASCLYSHLQCTNGLPSNDPDSSCSSQIQAYADCCEINAGACVGVLTGDAGW